MVHIRPAGHERVKKRTIVSINLTLPSQQRGLCVTSYSVFSLKPGVYKAVIMGEKGDFHYYFVVIFIKLAIEAETV
jgi:hypothetical protein